MNHFSSFVCRHEDVRKTLITAATLEPIAKTTQSRLIEYSLYAKCATQLQKLGKRYQGYLKCFFKREVFSTRSYGTFRHEYRMETWRAWCSANYRNCVNILCSQSGRWIWLHGIWSSAFVYYYHYLKGEISNVPGSSDWRQIEKIRKMVCINLFSVGRDKKNKKEDA
jgi:hypothetical protein